MSTVFTGDVLVVEDNFIIAMDVEELVAELGATSVHLSTNCNDALAIIAQTDLTAAILDFNIDGGTSQPIADALRTRNIPFIFATGYSHDDLIPDGYRDIPVLIKPYTGDAIREIFATL